MNSEELNDDNVPHTLDNDKTADDDTPCLMNSSKPSDNIPLTMDCVKTADDDSPSVMNSSKSSDNISPRMKSGRSGEDYSPSMVDNKETADYKKSPTTDGCKRGDNIPPLNSDLDKTVLQPMNYTFTDGSRKDTSLIKVTTADGKGKCLVKAETIDDLIQKVAKKLKFAGDPSTLSVVTSTDGFPVDDDDILSELRNEVLIVLRPDEEWKEKKTPDTECHQENTQQSNTQEENSSIQDEDENEVSTDEESLVYKALPMFIRQSCDKDEIATFRIPVVVKNVDWANMSRKFQMGGSPNQVHKQRTLLLVGSQSTGKTTLTNTILNHVLGVDVTGDFRCIITEEKAKTPTEWITQYEMNPIPGGQINYQLNIIDTPAFRTEVMDRLYKFLANPEASIDCIILLTRIPEMTRDQCQCFNQMFKADMNPNIVVIDSEDMKNIDVDVLLADLDTKPTRSLVIKNEQLKNMRQQDALKEEWLQDLNALLTCIVFDFQNLKTKDSESILNSSGQNKLIDQIKGNKDAVIRHLHDTRLGLEVEDLLQFAIERSALDQMPNHQSHIKLLKEVLDEDPWQAFYGKPGLLLDQVPTSQNFCRNSILPFCLKKDSKVQKVQLYKVPVVEKNAKLHNKTRKCQFGTAQPGQQEKTILMIGATGSGKSTLIDGFFNYILGVEFEEDFRFSIIDLKEEECRKVSSQAQSQTDWITVYEINPIPGSKVNYCLNIIDTPGFGDTAGLEKDKALLNRLKDLFTGTGDNGVQVLDCVAFVVQASLCRLTHSQRYIFENILSIFDKNIKDNINMFITFADGATPPVLGALKEGKIDYVAYFPFNNSGLFAQTKGKQKFPRMFWDMGQDSFFQAFAALNKMKTKSLQLTAEVLQQRHHLETLVQHLQVKINEGLNKLQTLKQERLILESVQGQLKDNEDFVYTVSQDCQEQVQLNPGEHVTNCLTCNYTCHYPCYITKDEDKAGCAAMSNGSCDVCPGKCHWQRHANYPKRYITVTKQVQRTYGDMKARYEDALKGKEEKQGIIEALTGDFMNVQRDVGDKIEQVREIINRLDEIAMRANPLTVEEYIAMMIQGEKSERKPGFLNRITLLEKAKEDARLIHSLKHESFNPWGEFLNVDDQTLFPEMVVVRKRGKGFMLVDKVKAGAKYVKDFLTGKR